MIDSSLDFSAQDRHKIISSLPRMVYYLHRSILKVRVEIEANVLHMKSPQ
jgi:hypothetical protein